MDFQMDDRQLKRQLVHMLLWMSSTVFPYELPLAAVLAIFEEGAHLFPPKLKIPAPVVPLRREVAGG